MILSMYSQVIIFLFTIFLGVFIGFLYDIFRIIRLNFTHKTIYINLEDTIYWLLSSFIAFYVMLNITNGEIRLYSIIGIFLGMIIYFFTISKIVVKVLSKILNIFIKYIKLIINIVLVPIKIIVKFVLNMYKIFIIKSKKIFGPCKKYVKIKKRNIIKELKIMKRKI